MSGGGSCPSTFNGIIYPWGYSWILCLLWHMWKQLWIPWLESVFFFHWHLQVRIRLPWNLPFFLVQWCRERGESGHFPWRKSQVWSRLKILKNENFCWKFSVETSSLDIRLAVICEKLQFFFPENVAAQCTQHKNVGPWFGYEANRTDPSMKQILLQLKDPRQRNIQHFIRRLL